MFHKHFLERNAIDYRHETVKNSEIQAKTNQANLLYFTAQKSNFGSSYFILSPLPYFEGKMLPPTTPFFFNFQKMTPAAGATNSKFSKMINNATFSSAVD